MANQNLSQFGEKLFVADADHTFIWDTAASISKRVSRNSWLSAGSIATSTPLTISQTWTDAAVAFAAMKIVATDTNSAAGSDFLELYSGTSTQPLRVDINKTGQINAYGTWTNAGNYERLAFNAADATFSAGPSITTQQAGSGVPKQLNIGTTGEADLRLATNSLWRWRVGGSTGHLLAHDDNAYDIGASGANRPRNVFVGSNIYAAGNVGIGTTAPATNLEVNGGLRITGVAQIGPSPSLGVNFYRIGTSTSAGQIYGATDGLQFTTNGGANSVKILDTGNVGIGTTSPTSKLHVAGGISATNLLPSGFLSFQNDSGQIYFGAAGDVVINREESAHLSLRNAGVGQKFSVYGTYPNSTNWERFTITAPTSGNVLLGTYKGTGGVARGMEFQTDGVTRMSINSTGAVTFDSNVNINSSLRITFINNQTSALSMFVFASDATGASTYALGGSAPLMRFGGTTDSFPAIARDNAGIKFTGGAAGSTAWVKVPPVAVTALPDATVAGVGARAFVNDALAPTFGSAVTGGGSVPVPVYSTGSAWNVG